MLEDRTLDEDFTEILEKISPLITASFSALADGLFEFRKRLTELGYGDSQIDALELAALGYWGSKK